MDPDRRQDLAEQSLGRVLDFFSRVESKASFVFAMNTGMLGLLALNFHQQDICVWYIALPLVCAIALLGASTYYVYRCMFPDLKGGAPSIVYFREIAERSSDQFTSQFLNSNSDVYTRDLVDQVWRNSQILAAKFDSIKVAFTLTALAILPWFLFLGAVAMTHNAVSF